MPGFILCYDIRDPRRLQKVHRVVARATRRLQWSVYYFEGHRARLFELVERTEAQMNRREDDLRIYPAPLARHITILAPGGEGIWVL